MKSLGWLPRTSLFVGLIVYMAMAMQGRDPMTALERGFLAAVILYGLGVFYLMAFWHLSTTGKKVSEGTAGEDSHGIDGASSGMEPGQNGPHSE